MISTKSLALNLKDVPNTWIFEHYLGLESLHGQAIIMKSVFNKEKTPSMHIYYDGGTQKYKFKDFSSGKYGEGVNLVCALFNCSYAEAAFRITDDYNVFLRNTKNTKKVEFHGEEKFRVVDHTVREWNTQDASFWTSFKISSNVLSIYNVMPLHAYIMAKNTEHIVVEKPYLYGYFNSQGELCKIYRPHHKEGKFIKVQSMVQGFDQLKFNRPYLVITSSLKDIMSSLALRIGNIELVAPDNGESSHIPATYMDKFSTSYKGICTLMDNDDAGRLAILKYENLYGVPGGFLEMSKDISDSIRDYGVDIVRPEVISLLRNLLKIKTT